MGVYIKGMDMPKDIEPEIVIEFANGVDGKRYARLYHYRHGGLTEWLETEPIPPHGRLIDAETLYKAVEGSRNVNPHKKDDFKRAHDFEHSHFLSLIARQKTIIEAEEEKT